MDRDPAVAQRAVLLDGLLARFLRHRDAFETLGPFTAPGWPASEGGWHPRIDERYLAGAQTVIGGLIGDLCARGPEGAKLAMDIVFARTVAHAEAVAQHEGQATRAGPAPSDRHEDG